MKTTQKNEKAKCSNIKENYLSILQIIFIENSILKTDIIIQSAKQRPDLKGASDEIFHKNGLLH
ncbi:hypothetical protein [Photorhabdus namnaonensis]|uniref:hypothetical protein n=1 Tax=Photorhabdus namnaonensis TaxID=1851568 RepID=UPI000808371A|nr:hypothetical protein [Photorhabdus namnaonensis]